MADSHKAIAKRWFEEVWNQGKLATIDELLADDSVIHDAFQEIVGPAGFKTFYHGIHANFSSVHLTLHQVIGEGDFVCVRWTSNLKQKDSGKGLQISGMSLIQFENGRMQQAWQNWDEHGLVSQLQS